jgi:hypothetical protein
VRIDLGTLGARCHALGPRLVEELAALPATPHGPRLFLDGEELEALLEERGDLAPEVGRLLAADRLLPTWNGPEESFAGPGCTRRANERGVLACTGAIALNLPRIARRVGAFREELFQGALGAGRARRRDRRFRARPIGAARTACAALVLRRRWPGCARRSGP